MLHTNYNAWIDVIDEAAGGAGGGNQQLQEQQRAWVTWMLEARTWRHFLTLEFREIATREKALGSWRRLVQKLNIDLWGNHYTRIVGHSYFAYLLGVEQQQRGAYHLHALIDQPLNYQLIHDAWHVIGGDKQAKDNPSDKNHIGFAWIEQIKDPIGAVIYVTKYVAKQGDMDIHLPPKWVYEKQPAFKPYWWQYMS